MICNEKTAWQTASSGGLLKRVIVIYRFQRNNHALAHFAGPTACFACILFATNLHDSSVSSTDFTLRYVSDWILTFAALVSSFCIGIILGTVPWRKMGRDQCISKFEGNGNGIFCVSQFLDLCISFVSLVSRHCEKDLSSPLYTFTRNLPVDSLLSTSLHFTGIAHQFPLPNIQGPYAGFSHPRK